MADGIGSEFQYFFFKPGGFSLENGLQGSSGSLADSVGFLVGLLNEAEVLEQDLDELLGKLASQELVHAGIALDVVFLAGEDAPELHGDDAGALLLGVLEDGVDMCCEEHDVVVLDPCEVVPDELDECLQDVVDEAVLVDGL